MEKLGILGVGVCAVLINNVLVYWLINKIGLQVIMIHNIMQQDTHPTAIQSKPDNSRPLILLGMPLWPSLVKMRD